VEFESEREASDAFLAAASQPGVGGTVIGTVAGDIDQFLVVKGPMVRRKRTFPRSPFRCFAIPQSRLQKARAIPSWFRICHQTQERTKANPKTTAEVPKTEATPKIQAISKDSLIGDWEKGMLRMERWISRLNDKLAVVRFGCDGGGFAAAAWAGPSTRD